MRAFHLLSFFALAFLQSPTELHAQLVGGRWETLHQFDGGAASDWLGASAAGTGDLDGDGIDDLLVGASRADPGGISGAGSAYVYSGATGALLHQFDGTGVGDKFGGSVAGVGDLDGDGVADLIVGAEGADPGGVQDAGSAYVYSGATGLLLFQFDGGPADGNLGGSVAGGGDIDGDGVPDLIVGAPRADPGGLFNAGSAYVYSGATGNLLHQFDGGAAIDLFGWSVAGAGDVNGDGYADLIVGAFAADPNGLLSAGSAYVYSGATGSLLHQFDGGFAGDKLGGAVASAGDVDGDGVGDLVIGAEAASPGGLQNAGSAFVYSGATGSLLHQFDGGAYRDWFGSDVAGAGDVDGDGFADLIFGAFGADPGGLSSAGSAYIYSGATGNLLQQFDGGAADDFLGSSVANAGDVDADGIPDQIVCARQADPGGLLDAGSAYVYSVDPYLYLDVAELSVSGGSSVQLGMDFPASEVGARYAVLASLTGTGPIVMNGLEIPLTADNVFNLIIGGSVPAPLQGAFGTLNANGQALATLSAGPPLAPAVGQTIYFAAVTYDVGPLAGRMSSVVRYLQIVP